ncbi:hypothetical protein [Maribacter sp. 2307ULW6-5]
MLDNIYENFSEKGLKQANHPPKKRWIVYESLGFIDVPGGSKIGKLF